MCVILRCWPANFDTRSSAPDVVAALLVVVVAQDGGQTDLGSHGAGTLDPGKRTPAARGTIRELVDGALVPVRCNSCVY